MNNDFNEYNEEFARSDRGKNLILKKIAEKLHLNPRLTFCFYRRFDHKYKDCINKTKYRDCINKTKYRDYCHKKLLEDLKAEDTKIKQYIDKEDEKSFRDLISSILKKFEGKYCNGENIPEIGGEYKWQTVLRAIWFPEKTWIIELKKEADREIQHAEIEIDYKEENK